jgi:hypothetical protein
MSDFDGIAYDSGLCTISQSATASDTRFWDMEAADIYYTCSDPSCDANPEVGTETSQDWFAYMVDDDPYNPFCTPFEADDGDVSKQCKLILLFRAIQGH